MPNTRCERNSFSSITFVANDYWHFSFTSLEAVASTTVVVAAVRAAAAAAAEATERRLDLNSIDFSR